MLNYVATFGFILVEGVGEQKLGNHISPPPPEKSLPTHLRYRAATKPYSGRKNYLTAKTLENL